MPLAGAEEVIVCSTYFILIQVFPEKNSHWDLKITDA